MSWKQANLFRCPTSFFQGIGFFRREYWVINDTSLRHVVKRSHQAGHKDWVREMNVNFFEWVREGVRQSVLLGFSDAIEEIGSPPESKEFNGKMASFIGASGKTKSKQGGNSTPRKRLGKSLKELDQPK